MMAIHTVAAGGGSILAFDGARFRVGPESAGANPGPACYRRGGPLTVTDANLALGKIQPAFFPRVFGPRGDEALDGDVVAARFAALASEIAAATGTKIAPEAVAAGFVDIAVGSMANAIKKISVARGYDVTRYTLQCFGGAGGQHACLVADALAMERVYIHPLAGVLSAYGMGLADQTVMRQAALEQPLAGAHADVEARLTALADDAVAELERARRRARADRRPPPGPPALRGHRLGARRRVRRRGRAAGGVRSGVPPALRLPDERAPPDRRGGLGRGRRRRRGGRGNPPRARRARRRRRSRRRCGCSATAAGTTPRSSIARRRARGRRSPAPRSSSRATRRRSSSPAGPAASPRSTT